MRTEIGEGRKEKSSTHENGLRLYILLDCIKAQAYS